MKILAAIMLTALLIPTLCGVAASEPPGVGAALPDIRLTPPKSPEHRNYLGLMQKDVFSPAQIRADIVIIQIFSMYCPHCQKEAPNINELYRKIENRKDVRDRIRLIGIGVGNSEFETDFFRKSYDIKFPLFPDPDFVVHKLVGEVRTPYFFAIRIKDGSHKIIYSKLGAIGDAEKFLEHLIQTGELK